MVGHYAHSTRVPPDKKEGPPRHSAAAGPKSAYAPNPRMPFISSESAGFAAGFLRPFFAIRPSFTLVNKAILQWKKSRCK
jgi:hypothetical protein